MDRKIAPQRGSARFTLVLLLLLALGIVGLPRPLLGGDWPQILGPHRNGQADDEQLAESWPEGVPPLVWKREVGSGLAGVAVADGRVVVFHRIGDEEIAEALDAGSGMPLWKATYPTRYVSTISSDDGPRCVPVVAGGRVFLHGADGQLSCIALGTGKKLWSRDTREDFDVPDSYFGAGSTPLVVGDKLLVNVGGQKGGAGLVAFDAASGKTLWSSTDEGASYSSPVAAKVAGVPQAIFVTRLSALGVDAGSGEVLWRFPFGKRGPTVNGANPVVLDDHLFLSASYGIGAVLAKLSRGDAQLERQDDSTMSSQYTTSVEHEGVLYGIDGRQDAGVARLRAIQPLDFKVLWTEEGFGMATIILADGKLVILKTDGELVLAAADPKAYRELARARLFDTTTQPLPALAAGHLYARDTRMLKRFKLGR